MPAMNQPYATDPFQIMSLHPGTDCGRLGIAYWPGGDFAAGLEHIVEWNAAVVVDLLDDWEMDGPVAGERAALAARCHLQWLGLPGKDLPASGSRFEHAWMAGGEAVRSLLRSGAAVLVHASGEPEWAATLAVRILVELGAAPSQSAAQVPSIRPGAPENAALERHLSRCAAREETLPETSRAAIADRAVGALVGLAAGDAVGTTLEFAPRDDRAPRLTGMVGGGPFALRPGEWTDDTAMALALADSLLTSGGLDEADLLRRFVGWWRKGEYSCTGDCFDIGNTVRAALERWRRTGDPHSGSTAPDTAGNGSLMRLAPVAIRFWNDPERRRDAAARQSQTTHGAAEAVDACILYADVIAGAIAGRQRSQVLQPVPGQSAGRIGAIAAGGWRDKHRREVRGSGYVADALEAALWCVGRTANFREAILLAANLREDADTTAAIAGQLAGALYGASGIPAGWRETVAWNTRITAMAEALFQASTQLETPA